LELFHEASRIREARTGKVITYSRRVFIPLTNLCRDQCGYCTFARQPGDGLAHTMTPEEVLAVARAGRKAGCDRA
jgi:2-iminoacetate synthase ThiH